ncbi:MAG: ParB/RepB/Spo0J family partition protein [Planctomycetota bacterium]|jgi:ParB/RepB/Spo0J family partition protein|nr:ParB/RepB/Spo0J family partition protein [Planctomycetota bacterium]
MVTNGQTTTGAAEIVATPIPVAFLKPSPLNRHCDDSDPDIAELAQTIHENGLISPITARPIDGDDYEIICGERRWRAFRLLERETIPCIVKNLDDTQAQIERIVENYQRRDPSFMEQGEAVAALMKLTDRDVSEVANRLGQSVSWVRRRAKLPNLIPAWREELAKDNTPYFTIRDHVGRLEEIAILPPATQQIILASGVLRYVKTTKEIRNAIAKHFMNLDAKPWTRAWEKKAFSGSGKKRCDACMRRSDRENALFADPDDANAGKKMCLDPECWKNKCLAWCKSLMRGNPEIVPIRQGYSYGTDGLAEFFGVEPVSYYDWEERDGTEAREGCAAAVGVFIDGSKIGTLKSIWLELPDGNEDDAGSGEDGGVSDIHQWRENNARKYQERETLARLIAADIAEYLADIDTNAAIPSAQLVERQLRAAVWFGIAGRANSEEDASLDAPDWNPLAWAWEQTTEHIAEHVANVAAEDIAQLYNGDSDTAADHAAAALAAMFAIPLDVIGARATEVLYKATHNSQDEGTDMDGDTTENDAEPETSTVPVNVEAMTDPDDAITVANLPYFPLFAETK